MAKAIISNKIYLDTTPELIQKLIRTLTYKIRRNIPGVKANFIQYDIIKNYKIIIYG